MKAKRKKDDARWKQNAQLVEAEAKKQIQLQKQHFEKEIEKHLDFTQQVVQDKAKRASVQYVSLFPYVPATGKPYEAMR